MRFGSFKAGLKLFSAAAILLQAGALATLAQAQDGEASPAMKAFPALDIPQARSVAEGHGLGGDAAVRALGTNIGSVAQWYGKSAADLRKMLTKDSSLRIDAKGRLLYIEPAPKLAGAPALQGKSLVDGKLPPLSEAFKLHSKPNATRKIVLNFQGANISGTYWNIAQKRSVIVAPAFNTEGDANTFTDGERARILQIWQTVAEDYAPFDVDVTTELASVAKADPATYATVVITTNASYGVNAPGVAYVSTFGNPAYEPAFVAYDAFGGNAKYIAEAASHEMGHRLGLDHDGSTAGAYYGGHGSGTTRWAPLMGNSYTAPVSQFSKGEYANANNKQDDFAEMARYLPLRPDTAGNVVPEAVTFPGVASNGVTTGRVEGAIEAQGDKDLFSIAAGAGAFSASVTPAFLNPDADLVVSLLDNSGAVLASANPATALNATLTASLPRAGTYYIQVSSTGFGNPLNTGYSDYGSRGLYGLTASYPAAASAAPKAAISSTATGIVPAAIGFDGRGSTDDGKVVSYAWSVNDAAPGTAGKLAQTQISFTTPGIYKVRLRVTDDMGFTNAVTKEIEVGKALNSALPAVTRVANGTGFSGYAELANAYSDANGVSFVPAGVFGSWSGAVQATDSARPTRSGVKFTSPPVSSATACFTFTLDKVSGIDPQTSKSISYFPKTPIRASNCPLQAQK